MSLSWCPWHAESLNLIAEAGMVALSVDHKTVIRLRASLGSLHFLTALLFPAIIIVQSGCQLLELRALKDLYDRTGPGSSSHSTPSQDQMGELGQPLPQASGTHILRDGARLRPGCGLMGGTSRAGLRGAWNWPCCGINGAGTDGSRGVTRDPGPWAGEGSPGG